MCGTRSNVKRVFVTNGQASCSEIVAAGHAPTAICLEAAARHVSHDIELLKTAWESRDLRVSWTLWFITARSLMDFFFRFDRSPGSDDILAADYGPWKERATELLDSRPDEFKTYRIAANKLSAHLTYARVDADNTGLSPSAAVHNFLLWTADEWLKGLPQQVRTWFQ